MKSWILLLVIIALNYDRPQCQDIGRDHYLVEFEEFTPPTKEMIASFEGFPSIPFLAPDIKGTEHFLSNYKGKNVLLFFWNLTCPLCKNQIPGLNKLQQKYQDQLQIISLADDTKAQLLDFSSKSEVQFPMLYHSKILGDGPYGGELGYPRMFLIDEYGIVRKVLPAEAFHPELDIFAVLDDLITGLK